MPGRSSNASKERVSSIAILTFTSQIIRRAEHADVVLCRNQASHSEHNLVHQRVIKRELEAVGAIDSTAICEPFKARQRARGSEQRPEYWGKRDQLYQLRPSIVEGHFARAQILSVPQRERIPNL